MLQCPAAFGEVIQSTKPDKSNEPSSEPNAWTYASEGTQLAITLLLGIYVGYKLDQHKGTSPWFTLAGAAIGIFGGLYNFLKRFLKK